MTPDLAECLAGTWARLEAGVRDRRSAFHAPVLATLGLDGRPRARTVVLRGADPGARSLSIHLDARSDKAAEIARDPRVGLHAYDAPSKVQVRVEGLARLDGDGALADAAWAAARPMSRRTYAVQPATGLAIPAGDAYAWPDDEPVARSHFTVARLAVARIEVLTLAHDGHRRARFDWGEAGGGAPAGAVTATWLVP